MAPVKELLNVVVNCEIWGRLRCSAASIGYRRRIRKGVIHRPRHAAVIELLSSSKYERGAAFGAATSGAHGGQRAPVATFDP